MFEVFVGPRCDGHDIEERIESILELDHGSRQIYNLYRDIENFVSDEMTDEVVPYFVDYITQCVYLFEIGVPTEQDGHKVFVTMNDRGLKLSPIDLLKGYFLSNIRNARSNRSAHQNWNEIIGTLKSFGNDEDSAFFKTMLRAQYAESIRGKNKGDAPGDFEIIGDSYHRWVADNKVNIGLNTADDFFDFLSKHLPNSVNYYANIRKAEETFSTNFPHVFYNAARGLTLQTMLILAAINAEDTAQIVSQKIRAISYYLDFYATSRILSGQDNTYDNIRDPIFQLVKIYRRKSIHDLQDLIKKSIGSLDIGALVRNVKFALIKRRDLLHLLARIATYLENELELTNSVGFPAYIDRNQGNRSFDVENIISNTQEIIYSESPRVIFTTSTTYNRDFIGGLILLPRSRNRSLQAKSYQAKVEVYQTENVLAQTLCTSLYTNNPAVNRFIANMGILLKPISEFAADSMKERGELYAEIARKIWGTPAFMTAIDETAGCTAMEDSFNL